MSPDENGPNPAPATAPSAGPTTGVGELLAPVRAYTRTGVALQVLGSACEIVPFIAIAELARRLLAGRDEASDLWPLAAVVVAALGLRALLSSFAIMLTHYGDARLGAILRRRIVHHLGRVRLGWFDRNASGEVKKATDDDIGALHQLVAHHAVEATAGITVPVAGLVYLVTIDWRLALVSLLPIPAYGIAMAVMMRDSSEQMRRMDEGTSRVNAAIVEFARGIAVVKTFGRTGEAHAAYRRATHDFATFFEGWVRPMLRLESLSGIALMPVVVLGVNLGFGTWFVAAGWVTPVDVLVASMVALVVPTGVQTLSHGMQARMNARAAAERLGALLATPTQPVADHTPPAFAAATPSVELRGVSFRYDDGTTGLDGVDLRLEPGTITALVGPSGSGKSTLASLVPRFHDPDAGEVLVAGTDVRSIAPRDLYARVGFVLQDVQLLHASVADNIALGHPDADRSAVEDVARAAQIHDRILALPRGYDSVVGEDAQLSGGEAQRVSIARAMLHDPDVLVLDEATAFADPDTEAAVQRAISALVVGRTLLVIAHRLDTVVDADQIAVLDGGRIVERGTHHELITGGGAYAALWSAAQQSGVRA